MSGVEPLTTRRWTEETTATDGGQAAAPKRRLPPRLRKLVLAAHVVVSVGWLGVVAAMLVLSISAATARDAGTAEAAYALIGEVSDVLVAPPPASLSLAALLTGVALSVGAKWGLFRYYWVAAKLALTAAVILSGIFLVDGWIRQAGALAGQATGPVSGSGPGSSPMLLIYASAVHLLMLGAATVISVYKPWGKTGRPRRPTAPRMGR